MGKSSGTLKGEKLARIFKKVAAKLRKRGVSGEKAKLLLEMGEKVRAGNINQKNWDRRGANFWGSTRGNRGREVRKNTKREERYNTHEGIKAMRKTRQDGKRRRALPI